MDDFADSFFLDPEDDEGNHEYKYHLIGLSEEQINKRATQMNFRISEGGGEAIYELGLMDDGCPLGLPNDALQESLSTLKQIADTIDCSIIIVNRVKSPIKILPKYSKLYDHFFGQTPKNEPRYLATILVRRIAHEHSYVELRLAIAGNVDSGKSSTIGVLTQGILDNGDGLSRQYVFNYRHEHETGRTSSIAQHLLGFDHTGASVNDQLKQSLTSTSVKILWPEIVKKSSKLVTFYDLAGHEKYFNTTIQGISGFYPDYCLLLVAGNQPRLTQMTKEHLLISLMKKIPVIILLTKTDIAPDQILKKTLEKISSLVKKTGVNRVPYHIKNLDEAINVCQKMGDSLIVPILEISNVTGQNLSILKTILNCLPPRIDYKEKESKPAKFTIQETFSVTGIGTVVSGMILSGTVTDKSQMWLGPLKDGKYREVTIKSIHNKRLGVKYAKAGQSVCFALRNVRRDLISRGMVLLEQTKDQPIPHGIWEFEAIIQIFGGHSTNIKVGYQSVIHISNVKQSAQIEEIYEITRMWGKEHSNKTSGAIRSGDRAKVRMKFVYHPVYIEPDTRILFREGRTRGVGIITKILTTNDK